MFPDKLSICTILYVMFAGRWVMGGMDGAMGGMLEKNPHYFVCDVCWTMGDEWHG